MAKKRFRRRFEHSQLQLLSMFLSHGYSLQEALTQLDGSAGKLLEELEAGEAFESILMKYSPKGFHQYFRLFVQMMPLGEAMQAALELNEHQHKLRRRLAKKAVYPLFLFGLSFLLIQLFSKLIVPMMLQAFSALEGAENVMMLMEWMNRLCALILWVLGFVLLMIILLQHPRFRVHLLLSAARYSQSIRLYISYVFACCYTPLCVHGCATIDALQYLCASEDLLISGLAHRIHAKLLEGSELIDAFEAVSCFDAQLCAAIQRGLLLSCAEEMLQFYIEQAQHQLEALMKRIANLISLSAYLFVGALVLVVFQVMMLPLGILENI